MPDHPPLLKKCAVHKNAVIGGAIHEGLANSEEEVEKLCKLRD